MKTPLRLSITDSDLDANDAIVLECRPGQWLSVFVAGEYTGVDLEIEKVEDDWEAHPEDVSGGTDATLHKVVCMPTAKARLVFDTLTSAELHIYPSAERGTV